MKYVIIAVRTLLGLLFVVFGFNAFFHFIPMPMPTGQAGAFMGALFLSKYLYAVKVIEIAGGLLLLSGRKTALGLTLLGPVIVNIALYDIFLDPAGRGMGAVIGVLALFLLWSECDKFAHLLRD